MDKRLIEVDFPLKQTSLDAVHEKNVRHGHISTLHIWPARRPLAASRAALIATLLPDPGNERERKQILEKLGGHLVSRVKGKEQEVWETEGGILHWGRESSEDLNWFREKILEAYGGHAPKVLDPFSGGGAIPLEAMRLGCDVTAVDINPVAWFLLRCTLEYPQQLAGKKQPLPDFALQSRDFMESYFKAQGFKGAALHVKLTELGLGNEQIQSISQPELIKLHAEVTHVEADLAWHVRAWAWWVLQKAKTNLAQFYPTVNEKTTVAYLWARTVMCKNCRATIPLLKTRWLCKKENKRVVLTMEPDAGRTGVTFGILNDAPLPPTKSSTAQKREHERILAAGTMSRSGVTCPCCGTVVKMEEIRLEGQRGRLGAMMTAVIVDGKQGKEYRLPTEDEILMANKAEEEIAEVYAEIPFGLPDESVPKGGGGASRAFSVDGYGFDKWYKLFTPRQLFALGTFVKHTRTVYDAMQKHGYSSNWIEAVNAYLAIGIDKLADYIAALCIWHTSEYMNHVFVRFALPVNWDFAELNPISTSTGNYMACIEWVAQVIKNNMLAVKHSPKPNVTQQSATIEHQPGQIDIILTDPPYYDAIPYSDLMDFFYVWLRRTLYGLSAEIDAVFQMPLSPKWDHDRNDGELIDDSSRFGGDKQKSKTNYEDGMFRAFQACHKALKQDGRLVIVFAHKQPDAWETLVSAVIRAGFVVDGSWPIMTEMRGGVRNVNRAALSSSIWLVCKKRAENARPGWDKNVLEEMQKNIKENLHYFWDAGIRGPDFVWAATGPALEAYSKHPIVKKVNEPGKLLGVAEFLRHVRRMVADFVVGRVLSLSDNVDEVNNLDDVTTYYLLHRNDFGMESAPIGPCILYAVSCGLSDRLLLDKYDLLARTGGQVHDEEDDEESEGENSWEEGTSSTVRLKTWLQRKHAGIDPQGATAGTPMPLIDQVHRLMHFWSDGDVNKVNDYLDTHSLGIHPLFGRLLQALIELAPANSDERSLLENISNHVKGRNITPSAHFNWAV